MDRPATTQPATARDIIAEILRNMQEGLEPLHYSVLAPSIFDVYLHPDDLDRLRGILPRILDEARRDPESGRFFLKDLSRLGTTINGEKAPSSIEIVDGEKRDRNVEAAVPEQARIGLADVLFLEFRSVTSHG
jgi:hypothetical protein